MKRAILLGCSVLLIAVSSALAAQAPAVTTGNATAVGGHSATVHGTVNPEGQSTQYAFQYGTTSSYGHETALTVPPTGMSTIDVARTISGLDSGTTYHYRLIAISSAGTSTGTDGTFKTTGTAPAPQTPPTVSTGAASAISPSGATVAGSVNPNGLAFNYYVEYGTTIAYGFQTAPVSAPAGTTAQSVQVALSGLDPSATYHYRLVAVSAGGTSLGNDASFQTTNTPPSASTLDLFGHTAFASPSGVSGVLVGCIGESRCQGSLTLSRSGKTLGHRAAFFIAANDGGVVHVALNATGKKAIARSPHLRVNVAVDQADGQSATGVFTLVHFS